MRKAGVLLHPTSLPNAVLDHHVEYFLDWMEKAGLSVWQMLPLGAPHRDRSPYQAYSSQALNPALLPAQDCWNPEQDQAFALFAQQQAGWLEDYALFVALRERFNDQPWSRWPQPYCYRDRQALAQFSAEAHFRLVEIKKEQFLLYTRWQQVRQSAHQRGIVLFGDLPIAVAYDSADVWANPQLFKLDAQLQPTVVAGVPPDYFSATGQRWGNPHYNWPLMQANGFKWWRQRVAAVLQQFDLLRIDHFRGLHALWEIPFTAETAVDGQWVATPGRELLEALRQDFPAMPFVAEDLGMITPEVIALRDSFALPGLSVLQFGFDGSVNNPHSVANQAENTIVYTGTHDNNTSCGWFASLDPHLQSQVLAQLPQQVGEMPWPLIVAALQSPARLAIVPMQDWLALDENSRTNTPGTVGNNWNWKFCWQQIPDALAPMIRRWLKDTQRTQSGNGK